MSDDISKISEDFKELMKLQLENKAQFTVIANLTKSNEELKQKIKHLESMLDKTIPMLSTNTSLSNVPDIDGDSEIIISKLEIEKLRQKSTLELLTYEDARKLELYSKILNNFRNKPRTLEVKAKGLSDQDLLMSLESSESKNAE